MSVRINKHGFGSSCTIVFYFRMSLEIYPKRITGREHRRSTFVLPLHLQAYCSHSSLPVLRACSCMTFWLPFFPLRPNRQQSGYYLSTLPLFPLWLSLLCSNVVIFFYSYAILQCIFSTISWTSVTLITMLHRVILWWSSFLSLYRLNVHGFLSIKPTLMVTLVTHWVVYPLLEL